jgi:hypothetical protein
MKLLLDKFRIPVSDVIVISDVTSPPSDDTKDWFESLTKNLVCQDKDSLNNPFLSKHFNQSIT